MQKWIGPIGLRNFGNYTWQSPQADGSPWVMFRWRLPLHQKGLPSLAEMSLSEQVQLWEGSRCQQSRRGDAEAGGDVTIHGLQVVLYAVWQSYIIPRDWKRGFVALS